MGISRALCRVDLSTSSEFWWNFLKWGGYSEVCIVMINSYHFTSLPLTVYQIFYSKFIIISYCSFGSPFPLIWLGPWELLYFKSLIKEQQILLSSPGQSNTLLGRDKTRHCSNIVSVSESLNSSSSCSHITLIQIL